MSAGTAATRLRCYRRGGPGTPVVLGIAERAGHVAPLDVFGSENIGHIHPQLAAV